MDKDLLKRIGKVELHCHLDGSLSLSAIRQLARAASISLPSDDAELEKLMTVSEQVDSLQAYLEVFDRIRPLLQTKEALELAAYDVARQAAEEGVLYIEIRFAPELSIDKGLTVLETVQAVMTGLERAREEFGIIAKILVCGLKQTPLEQTRAIFEHLAELAPRGLVGFDFAGNEADFPTKQFHHLLQDIQQMGFPFTFHAGECGCVTNITDALEYGVKRIGHGTALAHQPEAIQAVVAKGVTVEMCLTSNLQTGAAKNLADFPYQQLLDAGAKLTINTDNRTVSNTNLTKEYALYARYFGTELREFYQFNYQAIEASFASATEKDWLVKRLKETYPL